MGKKQDDSITFLPGELCSQLGCRCKRAQGYLRSVDNVSVGGSESSVTLHAIEVNKEAVHEK